MEKGIIWSIREEGKMTFKKKQFLCRYKWYLIEYVCTSDS